MEYVVIWDEGTSDELCESANIATDKIAELVEDGWGEADIKLYKLEGVNFDVTMESVKVIILS